MSLSVHILKGCAPAPLADYLKALGILRLVGEQADRQARGWWDGEYFCLSTKLPKTELESFFLETYEPTPLFNPWGARSGYYGGGSETTARSALVAIEGSNDDRLSAFREAIGTVRQIIDAGGGDKPEDKESSSTMIAGIRSRLRGAGLDWLDSVVADLGGSFQGPALFGTGGNEGSGGYPAPFFAAVVEAVIRRGWDYAIGPCLWGTEADRFSWGGRFYPPDKKGSKEVAGPFRQFLPEGERSPWDLLLTFEGALMVRSGLTRRSGAGQSRFAASPFYFQAIGIGAASSSKMDEYLLQNGQPRPGRGEQWFPLWTNPSTLSEIETLFEEGRCTVGARSAKDALDAVRSICTLGTARGISSFVRYGYLQRDNLATHLAVPLGRITVQTNSAVRLIDDLSGWIGSIHRLARERTAPSRLDHAHRTLANAVFAAVTHDYSAETWQAVLLAAARVERLQAAGVAIKAQPIPPLRPEWVAATDDGSVEFRLALALGSSAAAYPKSNRPVDPIRHHWIPLQPGARRFKVTDERLVNDPRVVASGRDMLWDLASVVERRLIEAEMRGRRRSRLVAAYGCDAGLGDLARFMEGGLDYDKLVGLACAFMAIRWDEWQSSHVPSRHTTSEVPDEGWLVARMSNLAWPLSSERDIPADARVAALLRVGDSIRALAVANRRLKSVGIRAPLQTATVDQASSRLWVAALAFPISRRSALRAASLLDPSIKGSTNVRY